MRFFTLILFFSLSLQAEAIVSNELNATQLQAIEQHRIAEEQRIEKERLAKLEAAKNEKIRRLNIDLTRSDKELNKESVWLNSYSSYLKFVDVRTALTQTQKIIEELAKYGKNSEDKENLDIFMSKELRLQDQLTLFQDHSEAPFASLLKPDEIEDIPEITNPFDIFTGISFNKKLDNSYEEYVNRGNELRQLVISLREKKKTLIDLNALENNTTKYEDLIIATSKKLYKFENALETHNTTVEVYQKRINEVALRVVKENKGQMVKLFNLGVTIGILILIFLILKFIIKKYITDNERFYMANKIITFINITLIVLIVFFSYKDKVGYLVTVLGFASAGIAIAMKDWFMSILGWMVIVFGGSIHVGDRIRVEKDGMIYVGDVMDVSLLRITVLEDITLTSYMHNRRAGRIIFVPNNYIFTSLIANYSHHSLKTVWDGIDISITFDSNHKKAIHIAKEITRKYAKGYTDITRKQLNKLRSRYNLKNTNVEPRIFHFIEENGMRVSCWYLTNAYATLTLRSVISGDIVDAFNAEDDITIAYPTQRLHINDEKRDNIAASLENEPHET
ncbi:MAG: mechanosensitive ion channel [Campylobacterota bacterium]|nr:mechanosensitive ion channel [Campylobacterota bacterium]